MPESFDIDLGTGIVSGAFLRPEGAARVGAVVLCGDPPGSTVDHGPLLDDVAAGLVGADLAAVRFGHRRDDPDARGRAGALAEDAEAVLRWLLQREDVDAERLGVLGCCAGSVAAAGVAAHDDRVSRLAFFAPVTAEEIVSRVARSNGLPTLVDPLAVPPSFLATLGELAPLDDVRRFGRPILIVRGAADQLVPAASVRPWTEALERTDQPPRIELIALAGHDLTSAEDRAVCVARLAHFFAGMEATAPSAPPPP